MQRTYGVVWRDGASPLATGKLELLPSGVRLEGRLGTQDISYTGVSSVHVGRRPEERIDGRPSIVLERFGKPPVTIATVAQPSLVGEIAERLAALQLDAVAPHSIALVVPLRPGSRQAVRELLAQGPPFDPEQVPELEHHEVFVSDEQAVFVFRSSTGIDAFALRLAEPELMQAALAWREHLAGPPHIAEGVYSWSRNDEPADLSFLPTPGPGDSDGGGVF
ncbi:MAG TPA: hypothetical protein VGP56_08515 [Gaiellaceae bacterium]|nr:hypothetical protein [Gaiellaceae bacterium]